MTKSVVHKTIMTLFDMKKPRKRLIELCIMTAKKRNKNTVALAWEIKPREKKSKMEISSCQFN